MVVVLVAGRRRWCGESLIIRRGNGRRNANGSRYSLDRLLVHRWRWRRFAYRREDGGGVRSRRRLLVVGGVLREEGRRVEVLKGKNMQSEMISVARYKRERVRCRCRCKILFEVNKEQFRLKPV